MSDDAQPGRATAYADLLAALLATRADPATARFDAEIAAAEAAGTLSGETARALRWWQRESLRGHADHDVEVVPAVLVTLGTAEQEAAESVRSSAESWAVATASTSTHHVDVRTPAPTRTADSGAPATRLLVAGLTVLSDDAPDEDG